MNAIERRFMAPFSSIKNTLMDRLRRPTLQSAFTYDPAYATQRMQANGKQFRSELAYFNSLIENKQNFSLSRFGDGEMMIVEGRETDLSGKFNGEHQYLPGESTHEKRRQLLIASLSYSDPRYFVGIACPCCVGQSSFERLKASAAQDEQQLTWANLFVNANYSVFRQHTLPLFSNRTVNLICHEKASLQGLPFVVNQNFLVGPNSWIMDYERLLADIIHHIECARARDEVFIFCAGVLSNIVIFELTRRAPHNTYIDAGSVFDVDLGLGKTRKYLRKGRKSRRVCRWN